MKKKRVLTSSSGSVDSISSLPDDILAHILSFLPIKRAASTTILSKRWKSLFQLMNQLCPSLYLDDSDILYPERYRKLVSFKNFVDKTLSCCNNSYLKKFSLKYQDYDVHRMGLTSRWISKALERGVSDLDLRTKMPLMHKSPSLVPKTLFINKTLVKLTLGTEVCLGESPLKDVCLPLLKSLFLHTVWFSNINDCLCEVMIRGCPELEELYLDHYTEDYNNDYPTPYYIEHDNIKKLTYRYITDLDSYRTLSINTPNLVYLDYSDCLTFDYESEYYFSDLLEARLDLLLSWGGESETCLKIMDTSICNVRTLYLSSSAVDVIYECLDLDKIPSFKNLTTLHFETKRSHYWKLLCNMIEKSPNLEILVLKGFYAIRDCGVKINGGNMVKVVEIQGYKGRLGESKLAKCFLWEMENLEEMKVNIGKEIKNKLKLQLTNILLAFPKRSSKCKIHVL